MTICLSFICLVLLLKQSHEPFASENMRDMKNALSFYWNLHRKSFPRLAKAPDNKIFASTCKKAEPCKKNKKHLTHLLLSLSLHCFCMLCAKTVEHNLKGKHA